MIETTNNKVVYTVANNPVFAFPIRILSTSDVHCYLNTDDTVTELVRGTDFSVESIGDYSRGVNVRLLGTLIPGSKLTITRVVPMTQDVNLPTWGKIPSAALERQLDKIVMIAQQLRETLDRTLVFPQGDSEVSPEELRQQITTAAAETSACMVSAGLIVSSAEGIAASAGAYAENASACMVSAGAIVSSAEGIAASAGAYAENASACMVSAGGYAESAAEAASSAVEAASSADQAAVEAASRVLTPPIVPGEVSNGSASLILSGGKAYRFDRLVSNLTIQGDDNTRGDTILFPANPNVISCTVSGVGRVGSSAFACTGGAWNHITVRDGAAEVRKVTYTGFSPDFGCRLTDSAGTSVYSSGDILSGTNVGSGRILTIGSRGICLAPHLIDGGNCTVTGGGAAEGPQANCSRTACFLDVFSGGNIRGGRFDGGSSGGQIISAEVRVNSGGIASGGTYNLGGVMTVLDGGAAADVVLSSGGQLSVSSGGTATGTVVSAAGHLRVSSGGTAAGTVVSGGAAQQLVFYGGTATGTVVINGAMQISGGTATETVISGGGLVVSSGGTATETVISGGDLVVSSGGTAAETVISGGLLGVHGGTATGTVVSGGGLGVAAGTAFDTVVSTGTVVVGSGGRCTGVVLSGGTLTVSSGGTVTGLVPSGGSVVSKSGAIIEYA